MHTVLVRAIITGFGFSLGAAIFKRVQKQLGLDDQSPGQPPPPPVERTGGGEPALQR